MDYSSLHMKTVVDLRKLAKELRVRLPAGMSKADIIQTLLDAEQSAAAAVSAAAKPASQEITPASESAAPRKRGRPRKNPDPVESAAVSPAASSEIGAPAGPVKTAASPQAGEFHGYRLGYSPRIGQPEANNTQRIRSSLHPVTTIRVVRSDSDANSGELRRTPLSAGSMPSLRSSAAKTASGISREVPSRVPESTGDYNTMNPAVLEMLAAGDCADGAGVLEIQPDGYGFLRTENYLPGNNDVYVSIAQIHRFGLRNGDYVEGKTRPQREGDRYNGMVYISRVNGLTPDQNARRVNFDTLIPVYPDERIKLEIPGERPDLAMRIIDVLAPIGKGQRGMIVSQPKAGKTTLLKKIANAITANHPEIHLIVLLIDERPEEVTDMKRSISGEVVYSTFDEAPENHTRVSEMVLERAQRLVEQGKDVVVLLDSITRLARAYNLVIPPTGRSLSGGLDPGALHKPKRFFGAARNIENGGSLTVIATALVETGSRMDDIIFEEFKGTGNMELHLDRRLSDRRIFPAIDMYKSGTRREELLLTPAELEGEYQVRKMLGSTSNQETAEQLISLMEKTNNNADFFARIKGWMAAFEKDGFSMGNGKR